MKKLDTQISIRVAEEHLAQLEHVERELGGVVSRANVARAAMRLGLALLAKRPALPIGAVSESEKRSAALDTAGLFIDAETEDRVANRVVERHGES